MQRDLVVYLEAVFPALPVNLLMLVCLLIVYMCKLDQWGVTFLEDWWL